MLKQRARFRGVGGLFAITCAAVVLYGLSGGGTAHGAMGGGRSSCPPIKTSGVPGGPTPVVWCVRPAHVRLGDMITLTVNGLGSVVRPDGTGCDGLVLFLGGYPINGIQPSRCDIDDGHVGFRFSRNNADSDALYGLLGRPHSFTKPVSVTVGSSATRSFPQALDGVPGQNVMVSLDVIPRSQFWLFVIFAIVIAGGAVLLGRRTSLLREPTTGLDVPPGHTPPYSLSRTQHAFWIVLVLLSYVLVYMITSNLDSLSGSSLVLIVISSGTAVAGQLISNGSEAAAAMTRAGSKGFVHDLIYDNDGVSLTRMQIVVWTITLGVIFANQVYVNLKMPEFSATLLTLMGISSGTYLTGKANTTAPTGATATTPAARRSPADVTAPAAVAGPPIAAGQDNRSPAATLPGVPPADPAPVHAAPPSEVAAPADPAVGSDLRAAAPTPPVAASADSPSPVAATPAGGGSRD